MAVSLGDGRPQLVSELNVVYDIQGLECRGRQGCGISKKMKIFRGRRLNKIHNIWPNREIPRIRWCRTVRAEILQSGKD